MRSVLVVSREKKVSETILSCFSSESKTAKAPDKNDALDLLRKARYDFVFIDLEVLRESIQEGRYKAVLEPFWNLYQTLEIIVMSEKEMIREAVRAVKAGVSDYITYPISTDEVRYVIENIIKSQIVQSEIRSLRDHFWDPAFSEIIRTSSVSMQALYEKIRMVAPTKSTVLFEGETGTGKGVLAGLLHRHSNRRENQFITVHCGAIPDTLLESELFGHEKGAFTGALRRKLGKFEIANGGTIFLDEIGTITPAAQIKLLQVLQDGIFQRVGGEETHQTDVRIIAATNADLDKMCQEGRFRIDLYYRLNVFPIEIPPLRDRAEDIPHLVGAFIKKIGRTSTKEIRDIDSKVLEAFRRYSWPGNIRELENLMERAYILETSPILTSSSFPGELFEVEGPVPSLPIDSSLTLADVRGRGVTAIEKKYLEEVLARNEGRIKESAQAAGITTRQLHKLMAKYGIRKEEFKLPAFPSPKREP